MSPVLSSCSSSDAEFEGDILLLRWKWILGSMGLLAILLIVAGCSKPGSDVPAGPSLPAARQAATGESIFKANNCGRCHMLNGQGGMIGPDLSHEGANPQHNAQWIADHIKNPKTHSPGSRMPSFAGRIPDSDIQTLAEYLAGLK